MTRKILYSPGYGAGWVSWCHGTPEQKRFCLEYPPFIKALESKASTLSKAERERIEDAIEAQIDRIHQRQWSAEEWAEQVADRARRAADYPGYRGIFTHHAHGVRDDLLPLLGEFIAEWERRWPDADLPYFGGLDNLKVYSVPDGARVEIEEYDGNESVRIEGAGDWL